MIGARGCRGTSIMADERTVTVYNHGTTLQFPYTSIQGIRFEPGNFLVPGVMRLLVAGVSEFGFGPKPLVWFTRGQQAEVAAVANYIQSRL